MEEEPVSGTTRDMMAKAEEVPELQTCMAAVAVEFATQLQRQNAVFMQEIALAAESLKHQATALAKAVDAFKLATVDAMDPRAPSLKE